MTFTDSIKKQPSRISLTSVAVPVEILELICKWKNKGETNGDVVKRIFLDWYNLKEEKNILEELERWKDVVISNKDKKISELENLLKQEEEKQQNE